MINKDLQVLYPTKLINYFQLKFVSEPKLRWVESSDPRLSHALMDKFLMLENNKISKNACKSNTSKLTCINKRRKFGIVVILF